MDGRVTGFTTEVRTLRRVCFMSVLVILMRWVVGAVDQSDGTNIHKVLRNFCHDRDGLSCQIDDYSESIPDCSVDCF